MLADHSVAAENVCVATVTYGRRWALLQQVLRRVLAQGVGNVVVIDNGSEEKIAELADGSFGARVRVVTLRKNWGSAGGFYRALECALQTRAEFIWLLDDDSLPAQNALASLLTAYEYLGGTDNNALLSFRPQWSTFRQLANDGYDKTAMENKFQGMHFRCFPDLFYRHILGRQKEEPARSGRFQLARIRSGAYGGLFLPRGMVTRIGLPKTEFYLYGDDIEYTRRIEKSGGKLYLCVRAEIEDLDSSWVCRTHGGTHPFFSMDTSDVRIYYGVRNQTILDREQIANRFAFVVNGLLFFGGVLLLGLFRGRALVFNLRRMVLIGRALWAGWRGDMSSPIWLQQIGGER